MKMISNKQVTSNISLPSKLNKIVTILEPYYESDDVEYATKKWRPFKVVHSNFSHIWDNRVKHEIAKEMQVRVINYYSFIMRYTHGINAQMRILYQNKQFQIKRVINHNEENRFLTIIAEGNV